MGQEQVMRRLTTIFYADVAGYSRLMGSDEDGTHRQLAASLDLIAERIQNAGGRVVHYAGDAVLASFESVVAAANCAIGIQRAMYARCADIDENRRLLYRIGINLGEVIVDRDDIFGDGVNVAARLEGLAEPGGICVSAAVQEQVGDKIQADFEDLGNQTLKNINRPIRAYRVILNPGSADGEQPSSNNLARISAFSDITAPATNEEEEEQAAIRISYLAPPSIMILPFKNLSGDPKQDAIVDGFRLAIQATMVKLSGLFLINVPVAESYRNSQLSAAQAGIEVGIRYVLHGAVQISGDRLRITVQLTDAPAAQIVWAERYDRIIDDIFDIQDEITAEVAIALNVNLDGGQHRLMWWESLTDRKMKEYVLQGLSHIYKGTKQHNAMARQLYKKVDALMPENADTYGMISFTYWLDAFRYGGDDQEESIKRAREYAEKSVLLGDRNGFGHTVLASLRLYERRHEDALGLAKIAVTRRVSCPLANAVYGDVLRYRGEPGRAIKEAKKAIRLSRIFAPWMANVLAASYRDSGEFTPSEFAARESLRLDPENLDGHVILCTNYVLSKSLEQAREVGQEILQIDPNFSVQRYIEMQPYQDEAVTKNIETALIKAGLPQ